MLKEVNKGERDLTIWMMKAIVVFCDAKTIIGGNKDFYYGIESLQLSRKTPASSGKDRMMYVVKGECEISPKYNTVDGPFVNFS